MIKHLIYNSKYKYKMHYNKKVSEKKPTHRHQWWYFKHLTVYSIQILFDLIYTLMTSEN